MAMSAAFSARCATVSRTRSATARPNRSALSSRVAVPIGLKSSALSRPARFNRSFITRAEEEKVVEQTEEQAKSQQDQLDPADGSVQYGAPLGDKGNEMLGSFGSMFSNPRSTEILNGRAAMVGFAAAIWFEVTKGTSLVNQVFNIRTFTLLDGNQTTTSYPGGGFYLALLTVLVVIVSSYVPKAKGMEEDGLSEAPGDKINPAQLPRFTADIEMFNGRAAMVGLVALAVTEAILGRAEF